MNRVYNKKNLKFKIDLANIFVFVVFVFVLFHILYSAHLNTIISKIYKISQVIILGFVLVARFMIKKNTLIDILLTILVFMQLFSTFCFGNITNESIFHIIVWPFVFILGYHFSKRDMIKMPPFFFYIVIFLACTLLAYRNSISIPTDVYLVYYAPLLLPFIYEKSTGMQKVVMSVWAGIIILLSYKRLGLIILFVGILMFYIFNVRDMDSCKKKLKKILVLLILSAFVYFIFRQNQNSWVILRRFQRLRSDQGSGRIEIWKKSIEFFESKSWIHVVFGNGYRSVFRAFGTIAGAHNDYLEIIIDYGIIGLLIFVVFVLSVIRCVAIAHKKGYKNIASILSSFAMFFVTSMVSFLSFQSFLMVVVVLYWGIKLGDIKRYLSTFDN